MSLIAKATELFKLIHETSISDIPQNRFFKIHPWGDEKVMPIALAFVEVQEYAQADLVDQLCRLQQRVEELESRLGVRSAA